ncbi:Heavy metal-associated isoprenylated plant protein 29 [Bienertia sinuspersici]
MRVHMCCPGCESKIKKTLERMKGRHGHAKSNSEWMLRRKEGIKSSERNRKKSRAMAIPISTRVKKFSLINTQVNAKAMEYQHQHHMLHKFSQLHLTITSSMGMMAMNIMAITILVTPLILLLLWIEELVMPLVMRILMLVPLCDAKVIMIYAYNLG